jgi:ligand-binding sensor domain-containing protein
VPLNLTDQADFIAGTPFPEETEVIQAFTTDADGYLWVSAIGGGLWRWQQGEDWQQFDESDGAFAESTLTIAATSDGMVWFGTDGDGLWRFQSEQGWRQITPADGLPGWVIYTSHLAQDGSLWLSTEGGLARFIAP